MSLAPIALFVFNRPLHTRRTVEALARNELAARSDLIVYSDAARTPEQERGVAEVRQYLKTITGFRSLQVTQRERNLGLAGSIISGVTETVERCGEVIVVEDDLVTSPHFLSYLNGALDLYRDTEKVISIHGYVYPVPAPLPESFFLKGADCWGWATWRRGWRLFQPDGAQLLAGLRARGLERRFDFNGSFPYTRMLKDQIAGKNDSWAVRWYASALLHDRLTLYPGRSLVENIGNDDSGTHSESSCRFLTEASAAPLRLEALPPLEDAGALREFERYFRQTRAPLHRRLMTWLWRGGGA